MNRTWTAFKPIPYMLAAMVVGLVLVGVPILTDHGGQLIPAPENVAEQFVTAMAARRITGAMNALSSDLQQQVTPEQLRQIVAAIEQSHGGIEDAKGKDAQEQGDRASAAVEVKLVDQQMRELSFPLVRENHEWKLASIDPVRQLAN